MSDSSVTGAEQNLADDIWVIIPARGGSVGVPRKNLRIVAGVPLIVHSIRTALMLLPQERVIVVTDSEEIADVAGRSGATVIVESAPTPPGETLDTKILRNLPVLRERGGSESDIVVTLQPTAPLTQKSTILAAVEKLRSTSCRSVLTVSEDRHLRWRRQSAEIFVPEFTERVNRQQLPDDFRETGGVIAARLGDIENHKTRVIPPVFALPVSVEEAVDVDTHADLYVAAHYLTRKRVAVRVDAAYYLGMGHVYRALALVTELSRHEVRIYVREDYPLSREFFNDKPYYVEAVRDENDFQRKLHDYQPDLIFIDILDTTAEYVNALRSTAPAARIVTFEDRGSGAMCADLVVAEFIDPPTVPAHCLLEGIEYSLLAPRFELPFVDGRTESSDVTEILVLFGGTDPSGLAGRALDALNRVSFQGHVTVVRGMGAAKMQIDGSPSFKLDILENVENMPLLMARADYAYTSAGRTIVELASMGTPSICLAQNEKEMAHTHAVESNGVVPLGLGKTVSDETLDRVTQKMIVDRHYRNGLAARARLVGSRRRNRRTLAEVFARLGCEDFPNL